MRHNNELYGCRQEMLGEILKGPESPTRCRLNYVKDRSPIRVLT